MSALRRVMTAKEAGMLKQISFVKLGLNSFSLSQIVIFKKSGVDQKITRQYCIIESFSVALYCKIVRGNGLKCGFLFTLAIVYIVTGSLSF